MIRRFTFPAEDELILISIRTDKTVQEPSPFVPNQVVVVVWDETEGERKWDVGFIVCQQPDDVLILDHLHQVQKNSVVKWKRPSVEDIQSYSGRDMLWYRKLGLPSYQTHKC